MASPTPEQHEAELLEEYLCALQAGDRRRCESLMRTHPELAQYADCIDQLHELTSEAATLPPGTRRPTSPSSLLIGTHFGKYRLDSELGRGGMGIVYQAHHSDLQRKVALKMILHGQLASSDQVSRFLEEARSAAKIQHPNVVQVYEVGEHAGQHYIAMEFLDGTNLERMLHECRHEGRRPTPDEAVHFLLPIVHAVGYLHQQNIVHRDLKPGNILLQRIPGSENQSWAQSFVAKIADFGLAKSLLREDGQCTATGVIVGTPSYMAPEQAAGRKELSRAVDIYALGAILYELLTGRPPFKAATTLDTLVMVLESEPTRPRALQASVPAQLEAIVLKSLEKDPDQRYHSANELAEDLQRFLAGEPVKAQPLSLWRHILHWTRREPALASHVIALAAFAAIIQVNYHISGNVDLKLHVWVLLLLGIWMLLSVGFQALLHRQVKQEWVACAWTATDMMIFSMVLVIREVDTGPLIIGYPILVAVSGLWFRASVVWFTTVAAEIGVLMMMPHWHGWDYLRENPHHPILVLVMIGVLGMVVAYQVERVRSLSRFYGSRTMM